jgi:hypothetical protein
MARYTVVFRKREQAGTVRGADKFNDAAKIRPRRRALEEQRPLAIGRTRFERRQGFSVTIRTVVYVNGEFISLWES